MDYKTEYKPVVSSALWTKAHLDELEKMFPECLSWDTTEELIASVAKRQVVDYVRKQVQKGGYDSRKGRSLQ